MEQMDEIEVDEYQQQHDDTVSHSSDMNILQSKYSHHWIIPPPHPKILPCKVLMWNADEALTNIPDLKATIWIQRESLLKYDPSRTLQSVVDLFNKEKQTEKRRRGKDGD